MSLFSDNTNIEDLSVALKLLKESQNGFLKMFDNSPVCMSMTTTVLGNRQYERVNKAFLEKFYYSESEIIGHTSVEIGILDTEESIRVRELITKNGALRNDYVKCRAKNGDIVHTISSIEFMEMNGKHFLVSFFIDITKIIQQQALIERHAQQLEAVNKELEAFSYSVSHDLRAPLRAIHGYTKMLEEDSYDQLDTSGKRALSAVQRNAEKMGALIDDLLEFARLGKLPLRKVIIDMDPLVADVLEELSSIKPANTQVLVGKLHPLWGDPALVKQVVLNLISNAIKYSSKKERPVIHIASTVDQGFVNFTIRDNGAGFDMSYIDKLFGVFQRLHSVNEFEGTGIGLAMVQRIISKHDGTIHAHAVEGEGATFHFSIPVGPE